MNVNIGINVICLWLDSFVINIKIYVLYVIIDFIFFGLGFNVLLLER